METLTLEHFQAQLNAEENGHDNPLFEALRALRHLAFDSDDILDGVGDGASGWFIWW